MASFQQLQQQKAELDLKIAQSMDAARRMADELEQARLRHEEIEAGTAQIMALMDKYNTARDGTRVVRSEYLEVIATRKG